MKVFVTIEILIRIETPFIVNDTNGVYTEESAFVSLNGDGLIFDEGMNVRRKKLPVDSTRLIQCIYNNGCAVDEEITLPSSILPNGEFIISEDSNCNILTQESKQYKKIIVGDNLCNDVSFTSISITNYPNLESITIGSGSLTKVTSVTLSIDYRNIQ